MPEERRDPQPPQEPGKSASRTPEEAPTTTTVRKGQSLWKDAWRRLKRNTFAMIGLVVVILMSLSAILADVIIPFEADYLQTWVGAQPPGYSHPAVIAETRFDAGEEVLVPRGIPDQIAEMMREDGTLTYRLHETEEQQYRVVVRRRRIHRITLNPGALTVDRIAVSGRDEYLVVLRQDGGESDPIRDVTLRRRKKVPEDFPYRRAERSYVLLMKVVRPKTKEPETAEVVIRDGTCASITRDGEPQEELRLEARHVIRVEKSGEERRLHHLLGTDEEGRDVFSRVIFGGRISLMVGAVATLVSVIIGVLYGAIAGYAATARMDAIHVMGLVVATVAAVAALAILGFTWSGWLLALAAFVVLPYLAGRMEPLLPVRWLRRPVTTHGEFMMRLVDILYGLPYMFLVILLMVSFGRDLIILFVALGAVQWLTMARIVRGQALSVREKEFVEAARMCGSGHLKIILRHLIPNTLGVVIVYATLTIPAVILQESFLAFIGLTVEFGGRTLDSWGSLVNQGRLSLGHEGERWWILLFPSIAMAVTLFSLNFLGDGLRDALDPQLKGRT